MHQLTGRDRGAPSALRAATSGPRATSRPRATSGARALSGRREIATVALVYGAYLVVREIAAIGGQARALDNAQALLDAELDLGLSTQAVSESVSGSAWLAAIANTAYLGLHLPLFAGVALWLFFRHPDAYRRMRASVVVATLLGLVVFATVPVAPPWAALPGVVDTSSTQAAALHRVLQPQDLMNVNAAFPSMHLAWSVLACVALWRALPATRLRAVALLPPPVMALAVVATGNHYIADVPAGILAATAGLAAEACGRRALSGPIEGRDSTGPVWRRRRLAASTGETPRAPGHAASHPD